jgi:hypothetical protein
MTTGGRVKRLREMVAQLERLPESPDRDRLLSEVRSRAVDVDTGVTPDPIRAIRDPEPAPAAPRPPKRARQAGTTPPPSAPPSPAAEFARSVSAPGGRDKPREPQPPSLEGVVSLEDSLDSALPAVLGRGGRPVPPWTLGLRA